MHQLPGLRRVPGLHNSVYFQAIDDDTLQELERRAVGMNELDGARALTQAIERLAKRMAAVAWSHARPKQLGHVLLVGAASRGEGEVGDQCEGLGGLHGHLAALRPIREHEGPQGLTPVGPVDRREGSVECDLGLGIIRLTRRGPDWSLDYRRRWGRAGCQGLGGCVGNPRSPYERV